MKVAESGTRPRRYPLKVWPAAPDNPSIDLARETRLTQLHGRGRTTVYGTLRIGVDLHLITITTWPAGANPLDVGAKRLACGTVLKVELTR